MLFDSKCKQKELGFDLPATLGQVKPVFDI
jgi:hypothetical protein